MYPSQQFTDIYQSHLVCQHLKERGNYVLQKISRTKRIRFNIKYRHLTESDLENFLFSDKSPMNLFYEQNRHNGIVWGSQEEKVPFVRKLRTVHMLTYGAPC